MMAWNNVLKHIGAKVRPKVQLVLGEPFLSASEKQLYRKIMDTAESADASEAVSLHPVCLGGHPVLCRLGTRDKSCLEDLLFHQVYLPPLPLRDPKVIVDLGSNVGYTCAHFAHLYPGARIIGVELDSGNYAMALRNTEPWREQVTLLNAAIWSSDGHVSFGGPGEDAFRVIDAAGGVEPARGLVRSLTMRSLMRDMHIERIDYLKMDIEGGEAEVVLHADCSWLREVDALKIELHRLEYDDFARVLRGYGFDCRRDSRYWSSIVGVRH